MTTTDAKALTEGALAQIQFALTNAESPGDFFAQAEAIAAQPANLLALPFETGAPDPLDAGARGTQGRDAANAPKVYEFLGAIDPSNASDARLWTYLALVTYRDYMDQRWSIGAEEKTWKNRVKTRWLMPSVNRGRLVRHGIARLWWIAALTYDPKLKHPLSAATDDPFAYTSAVLANEDRVNALFDREAGAIPSLVRAVLDHVSEQPDRASDDYMRALMKELNLIHGYRDLAALDEVTLRQVVATAAPNK